ncbi:MAG: heavy metal translocating P-type ATPase metal-binding domain-containing protein [Lentimicrobium sp.]|jgi:Cu+-exporting ATPase|nr:heavy metal translocating P-type ATPase metal-binding domain-containing protein [Lentimicrobium sp.]
MAACVHCGLDCGKNPVIFEDKPFCCEGCSMVYQILHEKKMNRYYTMMPTPGIRLDQENKTGTRYAFLDQEEVKSQLLEFSDGGISRVNLFIPAIHCSSCIWLLENLQTLHIGISHSNVNFVRKEVNITFHDNEISLRQLVELLHTIHYIPELSHSTKKKDDHQKANRKMLMKIGVAGFAFGNIMLLSFPDYLPGGGEIDKFLSETFGIVSFILALPVITFCSSDFFLSAFKSLRKGIVNIDLPISIGIIALFLESSWVIFNGMGPGYMDSLAGLLFFMLIGRWYQGHTYQSLSFDRDYRSYFPIAVTRVKNGEESFVQLKELEKGDTILVRNGELIPADAILEKGEGSIDYSFVTGESFPVVKNIGDFVFAGGRQTGAALLLRVEKAVEQSYLTRLWNEEKVGEEEKIGLQSLVNQVSHYFTVIILLIATASLVYWSFFDFAKAVYVFASVLIVACPCALALTIPFTFGNVMRIFGRNGFYIRNTEVIEALTKTDTIVFDKTGTITHARSMNIEWHGSPLKEDEMQWVRSLARNSAHPLSVMLAAWLPENPVDIAENFREIAGMGIAGDVKGNTVMYGSRKFIMGNDEDESAHRTVVYLSINHQVKGYFTLENRYRDGLTDVVNGMSAFNMHLISGDNDAEKNNLEKILGSGENLHFNQSPSDKLNYIRDLRKKGNQVIMIGDGLNDAGALLNAHVGVTIADDVYHFSPACDAILQSSKFGNLHRFIHFTHLSMRLVYAGYAISFLYNIIGLSFAVQGLLSPVVAAILMPLSSITVVGFSSLSVRLLARFQKMDA